MGTLRYFTDADGADVELSEHEGFVEVEVAGSWYLDHDRDLPDHLRPGHDFAPLDPDTGTHWTSTWSATRPAATGRYRAACDCGWRGSIIDDLTIADPDGEPSEAEHEIIMASWQWHTDDAISLVTVARAARGEREATAAVAIAVAAARSSGRSWAEIAQALGVTKQAAHERFRRLDEPD